MVVVQGAGDLRGEGSKDATDEADTDPAGQITEGGPSELAGGEPSKGEIAGRGDGAGRHHELAVLVGEGGGDLPLGVPGQAAVDRRLPPSGVFELEVGPVGGHGADLYSIHH